MYNFADSDPFGIILTLLNPIDLFMLKLTNKYFMRKINRDIVFRQILISINHRLTDIFGDKVAKFKEIMIQTRSVISGSFIIQCVLNEYWENSNINIFVSGWDEPNLPPSMENFFCGEMKRRTAYLIRDAYITYMSMSDIKISDHIIFMSDNELNINVAKINIDSNYTKLTNFLFDSFDFDICKNAYYINNGQETLTICSLTDIFTRHTKFKFSHHLYGTIYRYDKYVKRRFCIEKNIQYDDLIRAYGGAYVLFKIKKIQNATNMFDLYELVEGNQTKLSESIEYGRSIFLDCNILSIKRDACCCNKCVVNCRCDPCKSDWECHKYCPLFFSGFDTTGSKHLHVRGTYVSFRDNSHYIFLIVD